MQSLQAGACYFIMKPISKEEVNNLWQHVYRKHLEQPADGFGCERCARGVHSTRNDRRGGTRGVGGGREAVWEEGESSSRKGKSKYKIIKKYYKPRTSNKSRTIEGEGEGEKARVHWHPELHMKFLEAYQEIVKRKSKPIPKTIHEFMGVPGITRANVASHLQKYRMYLQQLEAMREAEKNSIENAPRSFKALYGSIPPRSSSTPIPLLPTTPPPPPPPSVSQPPPPPPMPSFNIPPQHTQGIIDYNFVDNFPYTFPIAPPPPPPPPAQPTTYVGLTGLLLESDFAEVDGFLRSREASPARMSFADQYNEIDLEELFSQELPEGTGIAETEQPLDVSDYQIDDFELRTDLPEETQP
ncbi:Two-component response regulator ARR11 [Acorus calamus]|uniref:Two-component response regulator ARR11 n=1 Tax=Acorus calamus TaxID=4465 RepID=A0AAV9DF34_ACOCL|nr:Two-component response regulator ARR11 [Acorus calamus]